ncbi:MAG: mercuric transporter MerT family protein [Gammaproteobacteria bacterium]|nr:mercuric transporter MerT family protein [Gammaproteobacteria bacterium]
MAEHFASNNTPNAIKNTSLIAAAVAAIGASLCCVGPLVLLTLGIGGAWIGNLSALEPFRPIFIGVMLLFLGLAFRKLYLVPEACAVGKPCANPVTRRNQRVIYWVVTVLLALLVTFPWYGPYLLD